MNTYADVLHRFDRLRSQDREEAALQSEIVSRGKEWNPEEFARQQIRGLVRQVFFGNDSSIRQVVFTAAEAITDAADICERVGKALALETPSHVAIVHCENLRASQSKVRFSDCQQLKTWSKQLSGNLWRVPGLALYEGSVDAGAGHYWVSRLSELRNQFEYVVIQAPAAGISSEAAMLGHLADGVVLVLEAHSTRKAVARKIKESLGAQSRILGMVLSERRFPVPERIYRHL